MAVPMSAATLKKILQDEGLTVIEVKNWKTHNRNHKGSFGPVHGVMLHHTVTKGKESTVNICYNGHAALPGPLCHGVITKDGAVYLVSSGRANHAGSGDADVLAAVINEKSLPPANDTRKDGNAHFYGFECENLGDGKDPWPAKQVEAMVKASAAIARHYGWSAKSVIAHKEWQPGKIDPRGADFADMDKFRKEVQDQIDKPKKKELTADMSDKEVFKAVWDTDAVPSPPSASTHKTNKFWKASSYLKEIYELLRQVHDLLKKIDAKK